MRSDGTPFFFLFFSLFPSLFFQEIAFGSSVLRFFLFEKLEVPFSFFPKQVFFRRPTLILVVDDILPTLPSFLLFLLRRGRKYSGDFSLLLLRSVWGFPLLFPSLPSDSFSRVSLGSRYGTFSFSFFCFNFYNASFFSFFSFPFGDEGKDSEGANYFLCSFKLTTKRSLPLFLSFNREDW